MKSIIVLSIWPRHITSTRTTLDSNDEDDATINVLECEKTIKFSTTILFKKNYCIKNWLDCGVINME